MPFSFNPLSSLGLDQSIPLDSAGKIPSGYLPSYVDDVEEYVDLASFPATGETGKIYVAIDTGFTYRWSGSIYIQINSLTGTFAADSGTEGAPSVSIGTADNGLYAPGTDQVAISSSGTQRVNFGTSEVVFNETGENHDFRIEGDTEPNLVFVDASTNRVGLGTSSPTHKLHLEATNCNLKLTEPGAGITNQINFGAGAGLYWVHDDRTTAGLRIDTSPSFSGTYPITLKTESSKTALFIDTSSRVGIGTTSPKAPIEARLDAASGTVGVFGLKGQTNNPTLAINFDEAASTVTLRAGAIASVSQNLAFNTGSSPAERARIDTSGRLLVGTSSASTTSTTVFQGNSSGATSHAIANLQRGVTNPGTNLSLGFVQFADSAGSVGAQVYAQTDAAWAAGSYPGRLVFSVTADGASSPTEAMRIKNSGIINIANTPVYADNAAAKTGGLVDGDVYRTSTGDLKIVYT